MAEPKNLDVIMQLIMHGGDAVELSLLMVHGQDHLMTSIAFKDLAKEIVEVYEKISK